MFRGWKLTLWVTCVIKQLKLYVNRGMRFFDNKLFITQKLSIAFAPMHGCTRPGRLKYYYVTKNSSIRHVNIYILLHTKPTVKIYKKLIRKLHFIVCCRLPHCRYIQESIKCHTLLKVSTGMKIFFLIICVSGFKTGKFH